MECAVLEYARINKDVVQGTTATRWRFRLTLSAWTPLQVSTC